MANFGHERKHGLFRDVIAKAELGRARVLPFAEK
jgi:hypothetical protein